MTTVSDLILNVERYNGVESQALYMTFDRIETRSLNPNMNDEDNIILILLYWYLFDIKISFQNERIRESTIILTVVFLERAGE
jgi:hypothetical protein